ncbi:MAG: hypothetical protein BroJett038_24820 [Chloroflexota bacterium]|nr:MAG: hypothetical protein BroJett038_24820 [Chloroflexota bacterium]
MNTNPPHSEQPLELCLIEGDGIGREIVPAAIRVLEIIAPDVVVHSSKAGWECFQACGTPLPEATLQEAGRCRAVLIGAVASPPYPVEGYFSPVVSLRRALQAFANLRPVRHLPVPTSREGVDLLVVRENTEDLYIGHEHTEDEGRRESRKKSSPAKRPSVSPAWPTNWRPAHHAEKSPSCIRPMSCSSRTACSAAWRWK